MSLAISTIDKGKNKRKLWPCRLKKEWTPWVLPAVFSQSCTGSWEYKGKSIIEPNAVWQHVCRLFTKRRVLLRCHFSNLREAEKIKILTSTRSRPSYTLLIIHGSLSEKYFIQAVSLFKAVFGPNKLDHFNATL